MPQQTLKLCILVEPSPFSYVSGYSNRYQALCHHLATAFDDDIQIITAEVVDPHPPKHWSPSNFDSNYNADNNNNSLSSTQMIPIHYTRGIRCPGYKLLTLAVDWTWKIPRVLWTQRPQILHVATPGFLVFPAILWSGIFQIPLVCSYHTHLPKYVPAYFQLRWKWLSAAIQAVLWWAIRIVFGYLADLVLVTSPQIQQDLLAHGVKSSSLVMVWQKGIDTQRFHSRHFNRPMRRRMMGLKDGTNEEGNNDDDDIFLLLYVGRLSSEKRLKDLLPILQTMSRESNNKTRLCLVGQGPQEKELKEYFAGTPTVFLGQLHGLELSQAFASANVFVMPSDTETLGFVVLESMASGVVVVGAAAGGIPDLIQNGCSGFLVEPGNVNDYVARLQQLRDNPTLRRDMAIQAQREMQLRDWEASMTRLRNEQYAVAWENFASRRLSQRLVRWMTSQKSSTDQQAPWLREANKEQQQTPPKSDDNEEEETCLLSSGRPAYGSKYNIKM